MPAATQRYMVAKRERKSKPKKGEAEGIYEGTREPERRKECFFSLHITRGEGGGYQKPPDAVHQHQAESREWTALFI